MDLINKFSSSSFEPETVCRLHNEEQTYFCLDHQEAVCRMCRHAPIHASHKFLPLNKVVRDRRKNLLKDLRKAKNRLEDYGYTRTSWNEHSEYIKVQSDQIERKIKKNFAELHQFLQVEEEVRLSALRKEEQKKNQLMTERIQTLSREMAALSDLIRSTEEHLKSDHVSFVNNSQVATTRIQQLPVLPEQLPRGMLLDEVKHVGNLKFDVWKRMKEIVNYTPVILDPNTANRALNLSEDLTSINATVGEQRPKNPERLKWNAVLASALDSGAHVWDVEVGDNTDWRLGVAWMGSPYTVFTWDIGLYNNKYSMLQRPFEFRNPSIKLRRIRVHVDTNKRSLSFSDSLTNTVLFTKDNISTWPHLSSQRKMYPFFYTGDKSPLKIIPVTLSVTPESQ
ncbi:E3 ubiquitin-protein ligase TRIM35-like [Corythoichthys intestinalis]|uniref:E3 ubiquitin-protein ligase TRIM35-like n=1 Tax=Corythoichthys intestinalis TaxID=161448 RepID=UPI0025A689E8|nr:E3 ubiquitin-protein ligase TRIM35-like [Corythoichthys intestinalis]